MAAMVGPWAPRWRQLPGKGDVDQAFFLWLGHPPPGGGGCLPAFLEILGALSGITLPPPLWGRPRVGWHFLGKIIVSKIFIVCLRHVLPDPVRTLVVIYYASGPEILGWNPKR